MSIKDVFMGAAKAVPGHVAGAVGSGLGAALGTAAVGGLAVSAQGLYNAAVKARAYRQMMESNPHLQEYEASNPAHLRQSFTSLYAHAPDFGRDPLIAGELVGRMMADPSHSGGYLMTALDSHKDSPSLMDRVLQGTQMGAVEGVKGRRDGGGARGPSVRVRPGGMKRPDLVAESGGGVTRKPGFIYPKTSYVAQEQLFPGMPHRPTPPNIP